MDNTNTLHAYLLMVRGNHAVVEACIRMIDDPRNDIFIRAEGEEDFYSKIRTRYSRIFIVVPEILLVWGGTVHLAEMELIKAACKEKKYSYMHLLSESCLPIKSQDTIHAFFDNDPNQMIYMHVNCHTFKEIQDRCKTRYPFTNKYWYRKHKWIKALALFLVKIKILFGVNRLRSNKELPVIWNGWNWFSIPGDFAEYAVQKEELLHRTFDNSLAADEVFLQTLAMNSYFRERMYGFNGRDDACDASKRLIHWNRSLGWTPRVFTTSNFEEIMKNENCFFARKFYAEIDIEIVRKIEIALNGTSPIQSSQHE